MSQNVREWVEPPVSPTPVQPEASEVPAVLTVAPASAVEAPIAKIDFRATYSAHVSSLKASSSSHDVAMKQAIGGEFEAIGQLQRELLTSQGLGVQDYLIDVGCGSGRLASQMSSYLKGRYLGIDIMAELIDHAKTLANREDWRFEVARGLTIPEESNVADMVCFFSVVTHLLHEESFSYLREAARVLKPGGKIVFSFLEFFIPSHWAVFEGNIKGIGTNLHLNQFMSRDGIQAWAAALQLDVLGIFDGDKPHIPLSQPVSFEDGRVMTGNGNLGQSVCILLKK